MKDVLLLNQDHAPIGVVDWQRAVVFLLDGTVDRVVDYPGLVIRSPSVHIAWPAVIALRRYAPVARRGLALTRTAVLARDRFTCQYCGRTSHPRELRGRKCTLTVDHVIPRALSAGGRVSLEDGRSIPVHSWENLVAACRTCNLQKGHATVERAGMRLSASPRRPGPIDALRIRMATIEPAEEWEPWLPWVSDQQAA